MWVVMAVAGWAVAARACLVCSPSMFCASGAQGAYFCVGDGSFCAMAGRCFGPRMIPFQAMIQLTLLEDSPALAGDGSSRTVRGAGAIAVGRQAARIAGGDGSAVVFSVVGYHEGGTAVILSPAGDGFALRREGEGRGARIEVLAVTGGQPGRVLARERLEADDALVVRVPFGGRTRVLVLQAATLPAAEAELRETAVRRALEESRVGVLQADHPPFELRLVER
jgi:hypothetical protein